MKLLYNKIKKLHPMCFNSSTCSVDIHLCPTLRTKFFISGGGIYYLVDPVLSGLRKYLNRQMF